MSRTPADMQTLCRSFIRYFLSVKDMLLNEFGTTYDGHEYRL